MKPSLPPLVAQSLSEDVLRYIYTFVPHYTKAKKSPKSICSVSPNMQRDLRRIQCSTLSGKNEMYLRDLEDFLLE